MNESWRHNQGSGGPARGCSSMTLIPQRNLSPHLVKPKPGLPGKRSRLSCHIQTLQEGGEKEGKTSSSLCILGLPFLRTPRKTSPSARVLVASPSQECRKKSSCFALTHLLCSCLYPWLGSPLLAELGLCFTAEGLSYIC